MNEPTVTIDRYGVMGYPVSHSRSPVIHRLFALQTGQDMQYELLQVTPEKLETAVRQFQRTGGRGLNITVPHKRAVLELVDQLSERAATAGAVNTLAFEGSEIRGDNTDGIGLLRDLDVNLGVQLQGSNILILGAGGATRGIVGPLLLYLQQAGVGDVTVEAPDASVLDGELGLSLTGPARAVGRLDGPLTDPGLTGTVTVAGLAVGPFRWRNSTGRYELSRLASGVTGLLLIGGPWYLHQWAEWGNPLLPYFNNQFQSPWVGPSSYRDLRFMPSGAVEWIFYPFVWFMDPQQVWEYRFRDIRVPLALLAAVAAGGYGYRYWSNLRLDIARLGPFAGNFEGSEIGFGADKFGRLHALQSQSGKFAIELLGRHPVATDRAVGIDHDGGASVRRLSFARCRAGGSQAEGPEEEDHPHRLGTGGAQADPEPEADHDQKGPHAEHGGPRRERSRQHEASRDQRQRP